MQRSIGSPRFMVIWWVLPTAESPPPRITMRLCRRPFPVRQSVQLPLDGKLRFALVLWIALAACEARSEEKKMTTTFYSPTLDQPLDLKLKPIEIRPAASQPKIAPAAPAKAEYSKALA